MRTRLILGVVAVVLLIPQTALAFCAVQPFDQVVRSSDAVLVGTVADATAMKHRSGIIVRLNVSQTLKGSADAGQRVWITSCGTVMVGPGATKFARQLIGKLGLYILTKNPDGTYSKYSEMSTPQMTLSQQIARAQSLLEPPSKITASAQRTSARGTTGWRLERIVLIVLGVGMLITGALFLMRRSARAD